VEAVDRGAHELQARFGSRLRGLFAQPMADPGVELLVGLTSDLDFGPLGALGLGGTATDLIATGRMRWSRCPLRTRRG
jgi:acyl-CoA synthetase (NDP forming)